MTAATSPPSWTPLLASLSCDRLWGGISDSVLSERLVELGQAGLFALQVDSGLPLSVRY